MEKRAFGGILLILCFGFALVETIIVLVIDGLWEEAISGGQSGGFARVDAFVVIFTFCLAIIALVGGVSAFRGRSFTISIIGAACGALSMGWNYMGTVCALAAIPVLVIARYEFQDEHEPIYVPYGKDGLPPGAMPPPPIQEVPPAMNLPQGQQPQQPPSQYYNDRRPPLP